MVHNTTYKVVQNITKVIHEGLPSYEDALYCMEMLMSQGKTDLEIVEFKAPITGLGRDPDLHH